MPRRSGRSIPAVPVGARAGPCPSPSCSVTGEERREQEVGAAATGPGLTFMLRACFECARIPGGGSFSVTDRITLNRGAGGAGDSRGRAGRLAVALETNCVRSSGRWIPGHEVVRRKERKDVDRLVVCMAAGGNRAGRGVWGRRSLPHGAGLTNPPGVADAGYSGHTGDRTRWDPDGFSRAFRDAAPVARAHAGRAPGGNPIAHARGGRSHPDARGTIRAHTFA